MSFQLTLLAFSSSKGWMANGGHGDLICFLLPKDIIIASGEREDWKRRPRTAGFGWEVSTWIAAMIAMAFRDVNFQDEPLA